LEQSLRLYFSVGASSFDLRFAGYEPAEVDRELNARLAELEFASALTLLAAVEAAFRIDYLQRCYRRQRDAVSRDFREIYRRKKDKIQLEEDIFDVWKTHTIEGAKLIGDLKGAFRFRHWLAHGRYWVPKLGQQYDYVTIYAITARALNGFPLLRP
jgi:hypothetical protein